MKAELYLNRIERQVDWLHPTAEVVTQAVQQEDVLLQL